MPTSPADQPQPAALLQLRDLSAGYGRDPVVRGVELDLHAGETLAVLGPNGAGKSTVMKACAGVMPWVTGSVRLAGQEVRGVATEDLARRGLGYVPQLRDVFRRLTVRENIQLGGYTLPKQLVRQRLAEVVDTFPILADRLDRRAGYLSGGERKVTAIARALMTAPRVLLLDEPTAGLAPQLAEHFFHTELPRLAARGVGVLLVEQRARQALAASDRACILTGGEIRLAGPSQRLLERDDLGNLFLGVLPPAAPA